MVNSATVVESTSSIKKCPVISWSAFVIATPLKSGGEKASLRNSGEM